MKRSTFRATKNEKAVNQSAMAVRSIRQTNARNNVLYDPKRPRSASELETMRQAAIKNPHGRAALMLANDMHIPVKPKGGVTVEDVAVVAPAGTKTELHTGHDKPKRAKKSA